MSGPAWIDLATAAQQRQVAQADVCIIGAGAAGIYLTLQLARQGKSVVLLEAGPATSTSAGAAGFDTLFEAAHYPGATAGRFFGMGGSTARWGGQLVPHTHHDQRSGAESPSAWAHIVETVTANAPAVLRQLGYRNDPDFDGYPRQVLGYACGALLACGIDIQAGLMMPFRSKNMVGLLSKVHGATSPRVFFNAVAKSWAVVAGDKGASRIASVGAVCRNYQQIEVRADKFVIAAGAIESARILLEINESASQSVLRPTAAIGCYLADHLSVPIADVAPQHLCQAVSMFAPRFSGSWMRSFRFLERNPSDYAPRAFAHFIYANSGSGFTLVREVLRAIQGRRLPAITPGSVVSGMGDVTRLAYRRFVNSTLYIPTGSAVHLQLDMEQAAVRANHVRLANKKDVHGRRMTSIRWLVSDGDVAEITETAQRFLSSWRGATGGLPMLVPRVIGSGGTKPYDAYHPVGTCRMGEDAEAVVDHDLKVWGVQNLWVSSTGVLPTAGSANPTFTMLCLAERLAAKMAV